MFRPRRKIYQWNTATAGTGGNMTSGEANDSICPRNWKLPTSNNTSNGSFAYLLTQYGVQSNVSGTGVDGKSYNIAQQPLFFVRSGYLNPNGPYLYYTGNLAYYWSSTPYSDGTTAYYLRFNNSGVTPSDYNGRLYGFSLRCLAR